MLELTKTTEVSEGAFADRVPQFNVDRLDK